MNFQIKTFYSTTAQAVENEANAWLKHAMVLEIISITYTTTPEPSQYYPANAYPGFKHTMVIAYRGK
ncbi:MAG TPA: hypothetical protein VGD65_06200 [Chryseosolibacter sp.]